MPSLGKRLLQAWNIFINPDYYDFNTNYSYGMSSYYRPDRSRFSRGNEKSIITAIYNRIAIDISQIDIKHVQMDENNVYKETLKTNLNECLTLSPNIDQSSKAFKQDLVMTMFDEGCAAVVPVEYEDFSDGSKDITDMRIGKVVEWQPYHVKVSVYNQNSGKREEVVVPKLNVAIVENPLYSIMNEPNSVVQRLMKKLNMLDVIDEQSSSGKLDLIIQLPYVIKSENRKQQAENRRKEIEMQLAGSKYGIAYTDGTEHITQLNRSLDNNLLKEVEYLFKMAQDQLGVDETILNGTANEQTMTNYEQRSLIPIISVMQEEMKRKFLTVAQRAKGESIEYFRDPWKYTPVSQIAELSDKFTRNEIMSPNEVRQKIGLAPSNDPKADELRNRNLNAGDQQEFAKTDKVNQ